MYSAPKKSGKTTVNAMFTLWYSLFEQPPNEVYTIANDLEQAQGRVFKMIVDAIKKNSDLLKRVAGNKKNLVFPNRTTLTAVPTDAAGQAGANPGLSSWTELWAYTSERSRTLWDEMTPVPTRRNSMRFVDSYAGVVGESDLLQAIYDSTVREEFRYWDDLPVYVKGRTFVYWDTEARMPWQTPTYYIAQKNAPGMRMSTYRRLHENAWVQSEEAFFEEADWDKGVVDPHMEELAYGDRRPIALGLDASTSRATTSLVGCMYDPALDLVLCKICRIWAPEENALMGGRRVVDLDETLKAEVLHLHQLFKVVAVLYDPYQLHSISMSLIKAGVVMVDFPQGPMRTKADQGLFDLVKHRRLRSYPHPGLRHHVLSAVAKTTPRGFRLDKDATKKTIDAAVSLSMAAYGALEYIKGNSAPTGGFLF